MIVTAKFRVEEVTSFASSSGKTVKMRPVTGGSKENEGFWKATPNGELTMHISNPATAGLFQPGAEIFIDFHVPEPAPLADRT